MAKTILLAAVAAVLCTFAVVSSSPTPLSQQVALLEQLDDNKLQALGLDKQNLKFNWINVTAILEKIEGALETVQDKIAEVSSQVEQALQNALQTVEDAAQAAADRWNQGVQDLVDKATQLGVDVSDCIAAETPLSEVVEGLKNDTRKCLAKNVDAVKQSLKNLATVGGSALDLLNRAKGQAAECSSEGNILAVSLCLTRTMPSLEVEALGLVAEAVLRAGVATSKAAALPALTSLCNAQATAGRAAEATAIVDATTQCIKEKLSQ